MKHQFLLTTMLFFGVLRLLAVPFSMTPQTPRKIELDRSETRVWFQAGEAAFEIVSGSGNVSAEFAAEELAKYLGKVLGMELPVVPLKTGSLPALIVGDRQLAAANGIDPETMDRDAFVIRSIGTDILLFGKDDPRKHPRKVEYASCGSLLAVYDFLERFAGVRFYFPAELGIITPRLSEWTLPKIDIIERPDMLYRKTYDISTDLSSLSQEFGSSYRFAGQKYNRMMTWSLPTTHGLAHNYLVERFGKTHPEYFALTDKGTRHDGTFQLYIGSSRHGQVCFSNQELKQEIYLDAKAVLTNQAPSSRNMPHNRWGATSVPGEFFCLTPNDSVYHCRCPGCWPALSKSNPPQSAQETSDFIWQYAADIAWKLKNEGVPGCVTMFSYNPYDKVPKVELPDNMLVQICFYGPWATGTSKEDNLALLQRWNEKLQSKPWLWNYCIQQGQVTGIPHSTPRTIGKYYQEIKDSISGVFLETETDAWHFGYLNYYVLGKVLWDTNTDVEALLAEHHRLMFGAAAAEMQDFFDTIEQKWVKDICANTVFTEEGPKTYLPSQYDLWTKIFSPSERTRLEALFVTAATKLANNPDCLGRLNFIRENLWSSIAISAKEFEVMANGQRELFCSMPEITEGAIILEGRADEEVWQNSPRSWLVPFFGRKNPGKEIAEVATTVRTACDQDYFYFLFDCEEPDTENISHKKREKDGKIWLDNEIEIFLNPSGDLKRGYQILLNSCGSIQDLRFEPGNIDAKWDSGAEYQIRIEPGKKWVAEIRLPRKNLDIAQERFPLNFFRGRVLKDKNVHYGYSWSPYIRQVHRMEEYGCLEIKESVKPASILKNGDFTEGIFGQRGLGSNAWITSKAIDPANLDRKIYRSGGVSLRLDENLESMNYYITQLIRPNTRYRLSFQLKLEEVKKLTQHGGGFYLVIGFGSAKNIYFPENSFTGTMPWTRQELDFTTPEKMFTAIDTACIQLVRANGRATGAVWIDDVKLIELAK